MSFFDFAFIFLKLRNNKMGIKIEISRTEDPWEKITGRVKIGKKIDVEEILKNKGFENIKCAGF